ncbi:unnamed protein product [Lampetra fluviatilis]
MEKTSPWNSRAKRSFANAQKATDKTSQGCVESANPSDGGRARRSRVTTATDCGRHPARNPRDRATTPTPAHSQPQRSEAPSQQQQLRWRCPPLLLTQPSGPRTNLRGCSTPVPVGRFTRSKPATATHRASQRRSREGDYESEAVRPRHRGGG